MAWQQFIVVLVVFCGPPAAVAATLGFIVRRARTPAKRIACWLTLAALASACWLVLIPWTRRTNDPVGEGLVVAFLIRWGPLLAMAWMVLQELLALRDRRQSRPGFPVIGPS